MSQPLSIYNKLQKVILSLESNQVLQQMKNDSTLYDLKMKYIKQLIKEQLNSCDDIEEYLGEIDMLKARLKQRDVIIESMKREYAIELQNIEMNCRQLIVQNQRKIKEKDQNFKQVKYKMENAQQLSQKYEQQIRNMRGEIFKLKNYSQNLKEDKSELQNLKSKHEQQMIKIKKQHNQQLKLIQNEMKESYEVKLNKTISKYEEVIEVMKGDMHIIKQSWERRCYEIENKCKEQYTILAIEFEQKLKRQLKEHAETLKLGKSIIFNDSDDIICKKVEIIERGYKDEMEKIEQKRRQSHQSYLQIKQELDNKEQVIKDLNNVIKSKEEELQKSSMQFDKEKESNARQKQRLANENSKYLSEIKRQDKTIQENEMQSEKLKQQLTQLNKKNNQLSFDLSHKQQDLNNLTSKLNTQNNKVDQLTNQIIGYKQSIVLKQQALLSNNYQIQNLKTTIAQNEHSLLDFKEANEAMSLNLRKIKESKKHLSATVDKLHVSVRKIKRQFQVLKQEVICSFELVCNKLISQFSSLSDYLFQQHQTLTRKHKTQMSELLDQLQSKQKQLVESISSEKQQMKQEIKQYESSIKERQSDIYKMKMYINDIEHEKKELLEDIENQRLSLIKLEEKLENNDQIYVNSINRVQKDISRSMASFNHRWSEQIAKTQQEIDARDSKLKIYSQKIDKLNDQFEQSKKQKEWHEQEIKKYKKKYENLKQERDEKIQSLLKKLQVEGKHRINLERQLKEVRMTIMKGTYQQNNNTNFSFNDKERQSNIKYYTTNSKEDLNKQREKQLSQIRQMIAKTYKVVDGPAERDIGRNISKKHLF